LAYLFITCVAGLLAGFLVARFHIPGGLMLGALAGVALFNIFSGGAAWVPDQTKLLVQIIAGSFIGIAMERRDLARLPKLLKPMLVMGLGFLTLNIIAGFCMAALSPLDLVTALMSAVPGGVNETPVIAADMGADAPKVAVMQTLRLIFGLGAFPSLILAYEKSRHPASCSPASRPAALSRPPCGPAPSSAAPEGETLPDPPPNIPAEDSRFRRGLKILLTLAAGLAAGTLGSRTLIPGMTFVFPIAGALILKLVFNFASLPRGLRKAAQILSGCYLGSSFTIETVLEMRYLVLPLIVLILGYLLNGIATGRVLEKTCGFSRAESMLITIPAGASDMALIAADMGIVNSDISLLQVTRLLLVMTFFPQIINLILYCFPGW
jgi:membrane AbrB-like protein